MRTTLRTASALLASLLASATLAQAPAAPASPAAPAAEAASVWPQTTTVDDVKYTLNEPAYTGISGNTVTLRSAIKVESAGRTTLGTLTLTSNMAPDDVGGLVELNNFVITGMDGIDDAGVKAAMTKQLAGMAITVPLAAVVQDIAVDASRNETQLENTPPRIVITHTPTLLVTVAGHPVLAPAGTSGWKKVTNTPFMLLQSADGTWWVRLGSQQWMTASALDGTWSPSTATPPADVIAALGRMPANPQGVSDDIERVGTSKPKPPAVMVATSPTVLVSMNGPIATDVVGPGVSEVINTRQVMLVCEQSPRLWVLASGRWFASDAESGPWKYVPASGLPASFAKLRLDGTRIEPALASIPGTTAAKEAAVNNAMVRTVVLDRSKAACSVTWNGTPSFAPVTGTSLRYATNASQPVIEDGSTFYCCDSAAWFRSAAAAGPWTLCDSVPASIYAIPPSCPAYPVTFVEVYGSTTDSVTFGFTPGYVGSYMQDGAAVFGTGYDYASTTNADGTANSYPQTYGNQASYDGDSGTWAPPYGDAYADYAPAMYPYVYDNGWPGWGWYGGYTTAWGWGWGHWGWNHNWNHWWNNWHPYDNHWNNAWNNWSRNEANRRAAANNNFIHGGNHITNVPGGSRFTSVQQQRWNQVRRDENFTRNADRAPQRNLMGRSPSGFHPQNQNMGRPGGNGYHPESAWHGNGGSRGGGSRGGGGGGGRR